MLNNRRGVTVNVVKAGGVDVGRVEVKIVGDDGAKQAAETGVTVSDGLDEQQDEREWGTKAKRATTSVHL